MPKIIRAADCPEVAWKNGGGTTREIAVFPPGAGMDDFLWRLSMAKVERAGAFSVFASVDRTLAVMGGTLHLTGPRIDVLLDRESSPHPFDGGDAIWGEPLDGPVLDLNAMVRRGRCACSMVRCSKGSMVRPSGAGFVIALEDQDLAEAALEELDFLRIDEPMEINGDALVVDFHEASLVR
jgi:environmental stress-induced protein Ves